MSSSKKSKNTTGTMDKSIHDASNPTTKQPQNYIHNNKLNQQVNLSSNKMIKKLSMSFYAQETIKNNKQIILDDCDQFEEFNPFMDILSCKSNYFPLKSNISINKNANKIGQKSRPGTPKKTIQCFSRNYKNTPSPNKILSGKQKSLSKEKRKFFNQAVNNNQKIDKIVKKLKNMKTLKINLAGAQKTSEKQISGSHFQHFDGYMHPFQLTINNNSVFPNKKNKILYRKQNKSTTPLRKPKTPFKNIQIKLMQQSRSKIFSKQKQMQRQKPKDKSNSKDKNLRLVLTPNKSKSSEKNLNIKMNNNKNKDFMSWFKVIEQKGTIKNKDILNCKKKEFF